MKLTPPTLWAGKLDYAEYMPRRPPSAHGRQAFEQVNVHAWLSENHPMVRGTAHSETIAVAQVHATLALAAATALGASSSLDVQAWRDAAGTKATDTLGP
jgi:hypothetical protein